MAAILGAQKAKIVEVATPPEQTADGYAVAWRGLRLAVRSPGAHNALNALMAAELCAQLGYSPGKIVEALGRFGGIQRRLERVDVGGSVRVVDDYGHNPAKLAAAWSAVSAPSNRVLGVWRPHGFGPLRAMMDPLTDSFAAVCRAGDRLWILPVYDAGGTTDRSINADALVARLVARGVGAEFVPDYAAVGAALARAARVGDTILVMGARDPQLPVFAREMATKTKNL